MGAPADGQKAAEDYDRCIIWLELYCGSIMDIMLINTKLMPSFESPFFFFLLGSVMTTMMTVVMQVMKKTNIVQIF